MADLRNVVQRRKDRVDSFNATEREMYDALVEIEALANGPYFNTEKRKQIAAISRNVLAQVLFNPELKGNQLDEHQRS